MTAILSAFSRSIFPFASKTSQPSTPTKLVLPDAKIQQTSLSNTWLPKLPTFTELRGNKRVVQVALVCEAGNLFGHLLVFGQLYSTKNMGPWHETGYFSFDLASSLFANALSGKSHSLLFKTCIVVNTGIHLGALYYLLGGESEFYRQIFQMSNDGYEGISTTMAWIFRFGTGLDSYLHAANLFDLSTLFCYRFV